MSDKDRMLEEISAEYSGMIIHNKKLIEECNNLRMSMQTIRNAQELAIDNDLNDSKYILSLIHDALGGCEK